MSHSPDPINENSPQAKRALLAQLLREKASRTKSSYPLSHGQRGLWFLYYDAPESKAYNIAFTARIRSNLDVRALKAAFQALILRHPSLRTTYTTREGQPCQEVHGYQEVCFEQTDAATWSEVELKQGVFEAYQRPFDLERGPLLRVNLFTHSAQDHVLLLTMHHIAHDGWSLWMLFDELQVLYRAEKDGTHASLPELKFSYADFVRWQSQMLASSEGERLWSYWQQQLAGELPSLDLPTDHPRPKVMTYRGASYGFRLTENLTRQLKALVQAEGVTLYMILLAAFQVLLHRYSGQDDILVGSPTSGGRSQAEFAPVVGYFVNPVVLRADLSENPTFKSFLSQVRQTVLAAIAHQDYPFPLLVERLQPQRDPSRSPIFQASFVLQKPQQFEEAVDLFVSVEMGIQADLSTRLEWGGLQLEPFALEQQRSWFDLTLQMIEVRESLIGSLTYNTDLHDAETISRMVGHFQSLLAAIVANPEQRVADLPLLGEAERRQLLLWNNTQVDYPKNLCIHQMFEAQVEQTPDAVAVVFADQQLTYRELNCRANQLGHYLQSMGVGPESLVGICLERSLEMIVGLLGILKAGGAYVPLNPAYPQERLAFMLEDACVSLVLSQQRLIEGLSEHEARVICLDTSWEALAQQSEQNLASGVTSENLAYVVYTSGSTGKPKGVWVSHRAVNRLVFNTNYVNLEPGDRVAQASNASFDAATFEIWGALLQGARLVGIPMDVLLSPQDFAAHIREQEISVLFLTTALFNQLASVVPQAFNDLRHLLFGGEAVDPKWVKEVLRSGPPQRLLHVYGPTESTTFSSWHLVQDILSGSKNLPIGRPISNTQIYLLSSYLQPVPIGVIGELYIGGDGLARGYLNRPELTALAFIPNPFSDSPGERLYKTGDLARYLPDGNIEFLGRIDHQVKIRGFRIELGEVEATLTQHPSVRESVVIARAEDGGNRRLVAYIVPDPVQAAPVLQLLRLKAQGQLDDGSIYELPNGMAILQTADDGSVETLHATSLRSSKPAWSSPNALISDVRTFLKARLPDYMVPAAVVLLEALPLTSNGKVDLRSLPAPDSMRSGSGSGYVPPRTPTESVLCAIWGEVLGLEQVGIRDNFFALGGDSILSIQVVTRANQAGLQLVSRQIFQYQTIADLAAIVGTTLPVRAEQGIVLGEVPLTPIQHWFFEQNLSQPHHFNQSVLLEMPPELKPALLEEVVRQILVHHDALRLRFKFSSSGSTQVIAAPNQTEELFTVVDMSDLPLEEQEAALEATAAKVQASLNLSAGPLLRAVLFDFGIDRPSRLLLVIHHLAVDGVSWRILQEDIFTACQQLSRGEAIQLPLKTTSFQEWAYRLHEYGQSTALMAELDDWVSSQSKGVRLPVDYESGKHTNTVASAAQVSVALSVDQTHTLLKSVPQAYNTQINDVLLTALVQAFVRWSGQPALLVNLEGHGREELFEDIDLSRTVGWFTSIFPVLLELREGSSPGEALKSVKEQLRRIPNRGIGYGVLRYLTQDQATRSKLQPLPQAEVSFNYLGQLDRGLLGLVKESVGLTCSPLNNRRYLLEVNAFVGEGRLQLNWTCSENVHRRNTIQSLAQSYIEALNALIAHCQVPDSGGYTPSDFPLAKLDDQKLSKLSRLLEKLDNP